MTLAARRRRRTSRAGWLARAALACATLAACGGADRESERSEPGPREPAAPSQAAVEEYTVPAGSHPHDVAVTDNGMVWYTAQATGKLGRLDPTTGEVSEIDLGDGSSPHGVIIGPDGAPWVTDTGLNAVVRVDPTTSEQQRFAPPAGRGVIGMHTAAFADDGVLWFTGNAGFYGRLDPRSGALDVFDAPGGGGPYGITAVDGGDVYFASLAQSYVARVERATGAATVLHPPTSAQGSRRVWADSRGRVWVSEWEAGRVAVHDPASGEWREWRLPGERPQAYAVYVDDEDIVWLSDFGGDAIVRFDPETEEFTSFPLPSENGAVRQLHGRHGEVWGAESAADKLVVIRTRGT